MNDIKKELTIKIKRYNPKKDSSPYFETFKIPYQEKATVLQALNYLYENLDPTLGFSYSCRYKRCGLCGVEVNGHPCMACITSLEDNLEISPLSNVPIIKDLIVDRSHLDKTIKHENIYLAVPEIKQKTTEADIKPTVVNLSSNLENLMVCMECLCCQASCPELKQDNKDFPGPYLFVKLAQLHYHPHDKKDRKSQAQSMGVETCQDCQKCFCTNGISIYKKAIACFLK